MTTQLKGTKRQFDTLRWLQLAASKEDSRVVLQCIAYHKDSGVVATADGFRIHATDEAPELLSDAEPDSNGFVLVMADKKTKFPRLDAIVEPEIIDATMPDLALVIPSVGGEQTDFYIDAQYLIEALKGMIGSGCDAVRIRQSGKSSPVEVFGRRPVGQYQSVADARPAYAVIMPMSAGATPLTWRPFGRSLKDE